jgi:hypothetical protein
MTQLHEGNIQTKCADCGSNLYFTYVLRAEMVNNVFHGALDVSLKCREAATACIGFDLTG